MGCLPSTNWCRISQPSTVLTFLFWIPHLHVDEIHMFDGQIRVSVDEI